MELSDSLIQLLCRINDPEEMSSLFTEILTPHEQHNLSLRWKLMQALYEGKSQRQIASDLGISLCKITRGSKIMKNPKSTSRKLLEININH